MGPMSSDRTEAVQAVVDRVSSYQGSAEEGVIERELRRALGEAGLDLSDAEVTVLVGEIEDGEDTPDAAEVVEQ